MSRATPDREAAYHRTRSATPPSAERPLTHAETASATIPPRRRWVTAMLPSSPRPPPLPASETASPRTGPMPKGRAWAAVAKIARATTSRETDKQRPNRGQRHTHRLTEGTQTGRKRGDSNANHRFARHLQRVHDHRLVGPPQASKDLARDGDFRHLTDRFPRVLRSGSGGPLRIRTIHRLPTQDHPGGDHARGHRDLRLALSRRAAAVEPALAFVLLSGAVAAAFWRR